MNSDFIQLKKKQFPSNDSKILEVNFTQISLLFDTYQCKKGNHQGFERRSRHYIQLKQIGSFVI